MAEQRAGRHPGSADGSRLTRDELATRADVAPERVDELTDAEILRPGSDRRYVAGDVDRIRIIGAFTAAGVPVDALAAAVRSGAVSLAYYDQLHPDVGERWVSLSTSHILSRLTAVVKYPDLLKKIHEQEAGEAAAAYGRRRGR